MHVLMLNGSSNHKGCTYAALSEVGKTLSDHGVDYEIYQIGPKPVQDCIGCGKCDGSGKCIFEDDGVNEFVAKAFEADGFVFGSPVYYAHPSGRVLSFLDRAFFCEWDGFLYKAFMHKPGAAVVSARRGGTTAALDVLQKYFGIAQMPTVGSTYWNMIHGECPDDALKDEEGMQTMRNLGANMAWLLKRIHGEGEMILPKTETGKVTDFIR